MEESKLNNKKGFTLVELLIAMLIITMVSLGLIRGILEYEKFTIRGKMKALATQILEQMQSEIEKLPYPVDNAASILHANGWSDSRCNDNCTSPPCCDFENQNNDNDKFPDFYDPYIGASSFTNPLQNINSNFRLRPPSSGSISTSICQCVGSNCPTSGLPNCVYRGYSGRDIYVGVNVVNILEALPSTNVKGKVASVVVWYFEPFTDRLQQMSVIIYKSSQGL